MRHLLVFCLTLAITMIDTHKFSATVIKRDDQEAEAQLQLSTTIIEQLHLVEAGSNFLRLRLNLTYLNTGDRAVLLDKKSSLVYRKLVSRNIKAASQKKYEYDELSSFITVRQMQAVGMRLDSPPEREAFITLKPGESYNLKTDVVLELYDGTRDTQESLRPGTHFLQVKVATWYYSPDIDSYREKWRQEGYLWSKDLTSEPMLFTVKQRT